MQEALITQRDGRFVVPVKAECKSAACPGLVHDVSRPAPRCLWSRWAVVQANNELQELRGPEQEEIERILRELSA